MGRRATPSCNRPITTQKLRANSVPRAVFSHLMPKRNFIMSIDLVRKKYPKMIGHMSWLYQYTPSPLLGPIKIVKNK